MQGTVDRIWRNERADGSEYWVLSIDGQRYTAFNRDLVRDVHRGDYVEFAYTRSGRYRNLSSIKRLSAPAFVTADSLTVVPERVRIVRMNCLRTAAELVKDANMLPERKAELVMTVAQRFERHVLQPGEGNTHDGQQPDKETAQASGEGKNAR